MIISRTPLRISFVGGGSDIYDYYKNSPGAVLSTAIDKYIYIAVNKKFDNKIRASYSQTEIVSTVSKLKHEYIKECLKTVGIKGGIEITSISDIPSEGTGLGSSSSYIVGLLNAFYAYVGKHVSAERLAQEACRIEIETLKKRIGKQDQYIAAFGGMQNFVFYPSGKVGNIPIICSNLTKNKLQKNLLLLYTGKTRSSNTILTEQISNIKSSTEKRASMDKMVKLAQEMTLALQNNKLKNFGKLLDENWKLKKSLAKSISSNQINRWYDTAIKNGAEGGKLLGAGGGGFLLFYADQKKHASIIKSLPKLTPIEFSFENQGSKIIFVSD